MDNQERSKKLREAIESSDKLLNLLNQGLLNPHEKIEITLEGIKIVSEELSIPINEDNDIDSELENRIYNLIDTITDETCEFNFISQNFTREEMTKFIKNNHKYHGFYGCPSRYGLYEIYAGFCGGFNCEKCWLRAIEDVKFKDEE